MKKNVVLTGMMGVGKSTIGRKLANKLKLKFADIDRIIEKTQKKTIGDIFTKEGEKHFRQIEKKITLVELSKSQQVIALGGGAFLNKSIRNEVKNSSLSFWLDLNLDILYARLKKSKKRPLLNDGNLEETINKIYSERKKIYNESNFKIKCDSLGDEKIVIIIIKLYENARNKS